MGISQGIDSVRTGVCTSTTRPASPYDGQVIYMTDVDQTAVWDGTQWTVLAPIAGGRNVIINGAMQVAQRGTSVAGITTEGYRTADRWSFGPSSFGTWTQSIENDAPTGSGFRKSLKVLCTTADASPAAGDYLVFGQKLEGQNIQHFLKGTSSAKQFTLSFWVKSNVTGTYNIELVDNDNTRLVTAAYTVDVSATWEKKTITFPADTTGAFDNDNANSLEIQWWLGAGTTFSSGSRDTLWGTVVTADRAVGQTNLAAAINNYWQVTGVQLEAGAVATPFEFEDYSETLAKCQRYFCKLGLSGGYVATGLAYSTTQAISRIMFPTTMRIAPTAVSVSSTASHYEMVRSNTAQTACSVVPTFHLASVQDASVFTTIGAADLVAGNITYIASIGGNGTFSFSAEL